MSPAGCPSTATTPMRPPRFGCRLMGFYRPGAASPPEGLRERFLLGSGNDSFCEQSRINRHGWGFAAYQDEPSAPPKLIKSPAAAFLDPDFARAVSGHVNQDKTRIALGHVRDATTAISPENTHPFVYENWSLVHNGTITMSAPGFQNFEQEQREYRRMRMFIHKHLGVLPQGDTGSEFLFYFLMAVLKRKAAIKDAPLDFTEVRQSYAQVLDKFQRISRTAILNNLVSDGRSLLAFRSPMASLFLGEHVTPQGQREYVMASTPPYDADLTGRTRWLEIPPDHLVSITPAPGKGAEIAILPLSQALQA